MQKQQYLYKSSKHASNLNNMRLQDKWCDVIVRTDKKEIRAHKVILAANLDYFNTMFLNDSFQESRDGDVIMQYVDGEDLEAFVNYAYTSEILLTDNNALNLLELANYLNEIDIKEACIEFLIKNLPKEEACRAYKFANTIGSPILENAAKATMVNNFGDCSRCPDYLNFDYTSLKEILLYGKTQPIRMQKMFFEGIMRWIMHDAKNRKIHMEDLLNSINITSLTADDVMGYLYKNIAGRNDEHGVTKDTVIHYQTSKIEQMKNKQVFLVVGDIDGELHTQSYDFIDKKWSPVEKIPDIDGPLGLQLEGSFLDGKFYYITKNSGICNLRMFDPAMKRITTLHSSKNILHWCSVGVCNRFVYLFGGMREDKSRSDQVLRYDPQTNALVNVSSMPSKRSGITAVLHQDCIYVVAGFHYSFGHLDTVEKYDPNTDTWTVLEPSCRKCYWHSVAILDGKLYVCGGYGRSDIAKKSVEVYDLAKNSWHPVASMNQPRWIFTLIAHEGKLWAIGGDRQMTVEVYDPSKDQWQIDHEMSSGLQMQFVKGGFISSSCITGV